MTSLSEHHSGSLVKMFYIGNSGTGKTGSLVSLIEAGFRLRILDLDNGLDALAAFASQQCPDKLSLVDYETRRDKYEASAGGPYVKRPKAFTDSLSLMTKWTDESTPATWGPDTIFVLDSLTQLGKAAFEWAKGMNPASKDPRQWFYAAQRAVEDTIALLFSEAFATNVIVISHVTYTEGDDNLRKGYPSTVGTALSTQIGRYTNTIVLADTKGSGTKVTRTIRLASTSLIDLKNPAPFKFEAELPLSSGMATIFQQLKART